MGSLSLLPLAAQVSSQSGAIQGRTEDRRGAAIAGARITVRSLLTSEERIATTSESGSFTFASLPIGPYVLRAQADGFSSQEVSEVLVSVGQIVSQRLVLSLATLSERLEVVESADALQAAATTQSLAMGYERMEHSPAPGRNYVNFVLSAPGIAPSPGSTVGRSPAAAWSAAADSGLTFGGMRGRNNSITIDGTDNRDETTGGIRVAVPLEMIQELRIASTSADAGFGGAAGGLVNIVTRSGSNSWHGHGEFMAQNEALNARNPEFGVSSRPWMRRWQPGGSVSGPVRTDRTFFAAAIEAFREDCDEWSETPGDRLPLLRQAVPEARSGLYRAGERDVQTSAKVQHLFNARHSGTLRYAYSWGKVLSGVQGSDMPADYSARGSSRMKDHSVVGSLLSSWSSKAVQTLTVHFGRRSASLSPNARGGQIDIPGFLTAGQGYRMDQDRVEDHYEVVQGFSLLAGSHTLSAGVDVNHVRFDGRIANRFGGVEIFPSWEAFLAGAPDMRILAVGEPRTAYSTTPVSLWFHDRWQVRPRLTIEAGVRYERQWMPAQLPASNRNAAPRLGIAWNPTNRLVLRGAAGLFFDRYPLAFLNEAIQKDGIRAWETYGLGLVEAGRARYLAPDLPSTYSAKVVAGGEFLVNRDTTLSAEYSFVRGLRLPRIRNAALTIPPVFHLEQTARSTYQGLTVTLHRRMTREFGYTFAYTGSSARDDGSDYDEQPLNPARISLDWSRSRIHQAHRLSASGLFELPLEAWSEKLEHIHFVPIFSVAAGRPLNQLMTADVFRTGAYPISARPDGVARNAGQLGSTLSLDLRVFKELHLGRESRRLQVGVEVFNATNHTNPIRGNPYVFLPSQSRLDGANRAFEFSNARQIQIFTHFEF
jgi:hypothetical protein